MKSRWLLIVISFVGLGLALLMHGSLQRTVAQGPDGADPIVQEVKGTSFDGDVRDLPYMPTQSKKQPRWRAPTIARASASTTADSNVQRAQGPTAMPTPSKNFDGLDLATWGAGNPPDTNGDVGPNHYIQTVNTSIGIFSKTTGSLIAAFTFDAFFSTTAGTTPCNNLNQGDPIVLYDPLADRWIVSDFAFATDINNNDIPPYYECIAVSKTGDPVSGGWWLYAFKAHDTQLNDYPKWGVWSDGYYMSANMYLNSVGQGARVWAFERTPMLSGTLKSLSFAVSSYFGLLPTNFRGTPPSTGSPHYFIAQSNGSQDRLYLWKLQMDWSGGTPTGTLTGPTNISVNSYQIEPDYSIHQLGTSTLLDALGDRLMMQLQYRKIGGTESLWVNHTITNSGVAGIRWYEIRDPNGTPTVYQQGTYMPDSTHRWMGSLAVDWQGNMALGFSASSSSMYPALRYAGRLASDPLNTLGQGETTLIAGTRAYIVGDNTGRWGDYSAMTVDPVDDCTFWYTSEYYLAPFNQWRTRIGSFKFPSCVAQSTLTNKTYLPLVLR